MLEIENIVYKGQSLPRYMLRGIHVGDLTSTKSETKLNPSKETIDLVKSLKPGHKIEKEYLRDTPTETMKIYVQALIDAGIDLGKKDSNEYGWRMHEPGKDAPRRTLTIFKRR